MSRIKHARRSPAIVIAVLALIAALAGTALAGSEPIANSAAKVDKALKEAKKAKSKAKKAIKLAKAADKEQGEKGDPGTNGTNGTNGTDGDDAGSMHTARINNLATPKGLTEFGFAMDSATPAGTLGDRTTLSPNADIVARDLSVELTTPTGSGSRSFVIMDDGLPTSVSCAVPAASANCNSAGATATIAAGSKIAIKATTDPLNTTLDADAMIGWRATTP